MNYNDVRKNENKGFSLVELIVVIAIMAVMTAVLAPSLLGYVEKSRAQKDDSAMGEVCNAIQIAMAEENVFNEVLKYSNYNNRSCYIDATTEGSQSIEDFKVVTKDGAPQAAQDSPAAMDQYMFDDEARRDDEVEYNPAGVMRGVTLTFEPTQEDGTFVFDVPAAKVNAMNGTPVSGQSETLAPEDSTATGDTLEAMTANKREDHFLVGAVTSTVGSKITLSSKAYRNSDYTVFIRIGSTGGNSSGGDAIKVYGQWNGTNLPTNE